MIQKGMQLKISFLPLAQANFLCSVFYAHTNGYVYTHFTPPLLHMVTALPDFFPLAMCLRDASNWLIGAAHSLV